ncbi:YncE family protein [Spirillospora sp. NPDC029432]|uniref:YncE family protein n=1 Tax=Spirillospora sp. NPDC029432 TaxID=3154599 RepID=UPI0034513AC1
MGASRGPRRRRVPAALAAAALAAAACESPVPFHRPGEGAPDAPVIAVGGAAPGTLDPAATPSPGAPRSATASGAATNVYAATGPGMLAPGAAALPPRVYVPNAATGTVDVLDQTTARLLGRVRTGGAPSLVVPAWNLRRLWVYDLANGSAATLSPRSARPGGTLRILRPGPPYFAPDGREAYVLAGRHARLDVRHPHTMEPQASLRLPCAGAASADYSADAASLVASCPAAGRLVRVAPARRAVTATVRLPAGSRPGDVRLLPDGSAFLVADSAKGGLWRIDATTLRPAGFIRTGPGARGLVLGRRAARVYVAGTDGTVSAVDLATHRATRLWRTPSGHAPLPGGVSADGATLWLSDPAARTVHAVSTRTGRTLHTITVGGHPGPPLVYPQPARHSLGGPGLYR